MSEAHRDSIMVNVGNGVTKVVERSEAPEGGVRVNRAGKREELQMFKNSEKPK